MKVDAAGHQGDIDENVQRMLAADHAGARLGIVVTQAAQGAAVAQLVVTEHMTNGIGVAQGGFVFALADQAFACAANSVAQRVATADASISFVAPAHPGDELEAVATVSYSDQKRVVVDVVVRSEDRVVALFKGTARRFRGPGAHNGSTRRNVSAM
ncbi:acyl-CoA thioesterase [Pseudarthrobacter enclensis]|uniref:hotdog fold thioesterase n=1 Tax=Pseudarthrobacter enclensis TaxID=993070 RepID=UPI00081624FB|nr:hotdog fold thioesterase [Pseudarthrobacter enclensis]SCC30267.1 acyl-CoA thioesterase [Pseudarthrobacter enclensis]